MVKKLSPSWVRIAVLSMAAFFALTLAVNDYVQFRQLSERGTDVWYSASWLRAPVTNFMLLGHESRELLKTNAVGSEQWHVREVRYGSTTFWTTLSRDAVTGK
uniref:Uncharacterized protein n=1 Tax=viral metagenome TaxID=1070528 RepID=A0A6H1ZIM1_9ZZZZ